MFPAVTSRCEYSIVGAQRRAPDLSQGLISGISKAEGTAQKESETRVEGIRQFSKGEWKQEWRVPTERLLKERSQQKES